jgi:hypothetical protein
MQTTHNIATAFLSWLLVARLLGGVVVLPVSADEQTIDEQVDQQLEEQVDEQLDDRLEGATSEGATLEGATIEMEDILEVTQVVVQEAHTGVNSIVATASAAIETHTPVETTYYPVAATHSSALETGDISLHLSSYTELNTTTVGSGTLELQNHETPLVHQIDTRANLRQCSEGGLSTDDYGKLISSGNLSGEYSQLTTLTSSVEQVGTTGKNTLFAEHGELRTGDISLQINTFSLVNTLAIGECWYFGVVNLFAGGSGDIILPSVQSSSSTLEQPDDERAATEAAKTAETAYELSQVAEYNLELELQAETGLNSGGDELRTGSITTETTTATVLNTSLTGDDWMLVRMLNPHFWQGSILGSAADFYTAEENTAYYWWRLPSNLTTSASSSSAQIKQEAVITHSLTQTAVTGANTLEAVRGSISTGAVTLIQKVSSFINTAVIGNNWFFLTVALFDVYSGNLVFLPATSSTAASSGEDQGGELELEQTAQSGKPPIQESAQQSLPVASVGEVFYSFDAQVVGRATQQGERAGGSTLTPEVQTFPESVEVESGELFSTQALDNSPLKGFPVLGASATLAVPRAKVASEHTAWCAKHQAWCTAFGVAIGAVPLSALVRRE